MTVRKLTFRNLAIVSLLTTYLFLPLLYFVPHLKQLVTGVYREYDMIFDSLAEYLHYIFQSFWFVNIFFLLINQLPYAIFRFYFQEKLINTRLKEILYYFGFNCATVVISGWAVFFYYNPWPPGYKYTFVLTLLVFSTAVVLFQTLVLKLISRDRLALG